ncbi:transcriptional regulator GcvA [Actibacterium sp. 188UL27-1]|uniref:transcriptional regulator GcvA n=1 Tax=Actibacterium sp. 188UL27-1 TaxID=2786961 RepID=UPI001959C6BE|nr:transcriptional regulator GcvA [Actibacterium sp. 188UL27-1]MBM7066314.1 transcriptional regulator GcvA [Actibacterium sp. 188UL27-1]
MNDRLPPLTALRAFEAAARHLSFSKAAAELNVTPAALSFQIKSLEEHLGQPVFRRLNRAVELTQVGRMLYPGTADGFAALTDSWRAARRMGDQTALTITAGPAFTAKWLAPRLFHFAQKHPEIELRFTATLRILDFARDEVDVAIRFGLTADDGLYSVPIIREWLTPMMTPALAADFATPADLHHAPLLHQDDTRFLKPPIDWAAWFRAADIGVAPSHGGPTFSQADHAIDAALEGAGVVLGRISLTQKALREGRLVAPYATALTTEAHYRFVCPKGAEMRPQVKAFLEWMEAETADLSSYEASKILIPAADVAP